MAVRGSSRLVQASCRPIKLSLYDWALLPQLHGCSRCWSCQSSSFGLFPSVWISHRVCGQGPPKVALSGVVCPPFETMARVLLCAFMRQPRRRLGQVRTDLHACCVESRKHFCIVDSVFVFSHTVRRTETRLTRGLFDWTANFRSSLHPPKTD